MTFSTAAIWWIAAGVLVALELATGTFYLLMIALGVAVGAIAALVGVTATGQVLTAAMVAAGATALWHWQRRRRPHEAPARENRDVNLDIGEPVDVGEWAADGTARVQYRGSAWTARLAPGATAAPGRHRVSAVEGNWLVLTPL